MPLDRASTLRVRCLSVLVLVLWLSACAREARPLERDPHSFSRPDEVAVEHMALDLAVDFERKVIEGRVSLRLDNRKGGRELWLDTRDLDIRGVKLDDAAGPADYRLGEPAPFMGRPLIVGIGPDTRIVHVDYASRPEAVALQWLEPSLTGGGEHPFLLSQSQAILARTWIPCQDSPGVRVTYEARLQVPPGLMAVMSAENSTEKDPDGRYTFQMPQPIPSYLLALAVGDLEFRELGPRSGVYAEPEVIQQAAWEFADTERMIDAAEALYGPYRWGRYDLIVLPSSFPFGGMENPRLTFVTPTVLAGDRSLVNLVAHELAHSWSGNLVTNATWNDFWLNEGFTVYFENRIMERMRGRAYSEMLALLGRMDLQASIDMMGADSPDRHLYLDLAGRDPDEGATYVPYEKGFLFLRMLEEHFGRERWDRFLRDYFDRFGFASMTTARFLRLLRRELILDEWTERQLRIEEWVYGPGVPANEPRFESEAFDKVDAQLDAWIAGAPAADLPAPTWSTQEWLHFLQGIPDSLSSERLAELDAAFRLSDSSNSEILYSWLVEVLEHGYEPAYPALERFLLGMGRIRLLEPLYSELARTPEGRARGRRIYEKARQRYHPLAVATVDPILGWPWK